MTAAEKEPGKAPKVDRPFFEAPIFRHLRAASFTFAFELEYEGPNGEEPERTAYRLRRISDDLSRLKDGSEAQQDIFRTLIQPVRSFLDDVTMGPAGTNGRPLLFAASGARPNAESRSLWLARQPHWTYEYENKVSGLRVDGKQHLHHFRLRDSFAAFESGRLFYLLTFTQPMADDEEARTDKEDLADPDMPWAGLGEDEAGLDSPWLGNAALGTQPIDEYTVVQLQQLALEPEKAGDATYFGFWPHVQPPGREDEPLSLVDLARHRLRTLRAGEPGGPNGIADIILDRDLVPRDFRRKPLTEKSLRRLCIGLECEEMLDTADRVYRRFLPAAEQGPTADPTGRHRYRIAQERPERGWLYKNATVRTELDRLWINGFRLPGDVAGRPPHHDPDNAFDRSFLAFAGVAQGVPDFPYQDESEIHDSTRPAYRSVESSLYVHPRFVLEVAKSWRSFTASRPNIGTCPYLLLMFVVALHDEMIVTELEMEIDDLVYDHGAIGRRGARSRPMADVRSILVNAKAMFGRQETILQRNLNRRFELFRWGTIQRSGNIFRYDKERGALAAIQSAMSTGDRFVRAHDAIDRMEALVEDVADLKSSYANRRTNGLLFLLALVGLVGLPKSLKEFFDTIGFVGIDLAWFQGVAIFVALAIATWFLWNWWDGRAAAQERRERKSS